MKKIFLYISALLLLLAGCAHNTAQPSTSASPVTETAPLPISIPELEMPSAQSVSYIDYLPPDMTTASYCDESEITIILDWLDQIELTAPSDMETEAPGDWSNYVIHCFDGSEFKVFFSGDTVSFGEGRYTYKSTLEKPLTERDIWLSAGQQSYAVTEEIVVELYNQTGGEIAVTFAPKLEQATENGWVHVKCEGLFCGTPDPVDQSVTPMTLLMSEWYPNIQAGTYRLSLTAYDSDFEPFTVSCVFVLE